MQNTLALRQTLKKNVDFEQSNRNIMPKRGKIVPHVVRQAVLRGIHLKVPYSQIAAMHNISKGVISKIYKVGLKSKVIKFFTFYVHFETDISRKLA